MLSQNGLFHFFLIDMEITAIHFQNSFSTEIFLIRFGHTTIVSNRLSGRSCVFRSDNIAVRLLENLTKRNNKIGLKEIYSIMNHGLV